MHHEVRIALCCSMKDSDGKQIQCVHLLGKLRGASVSVNCISKGGCGLVNRAQCPVYLPPSISTWHAMKV